MKALGDGIGTKSQNLSYKIRRMPWSALMR
jgi:hypothetical protein